MKWFGCVATFLNFQSIFPHSLTSNAQCHPNTPAPPSSSSTLLNVKILRRLGLKDIFIWSYNLIGKISQFYTNIVENIRHVNASLIFYLILWFEPLKESWRWKHRTWAWNTLPNMGLQPRGKMRSWKWKTKMRVLHSVGRRSLWKITSRYWTDNGSPTERECARTANLGWRC